MPVGHQDYTVTKAVRVPMRDGVQLLTDIYVPVGKSRGTVLVRTPYGRAGTITAVTARRISRKSNSARLNPSPRIGFINGEISIAPITTAGDESNRPRTAIPADIIVMKA